MPSLCDWFVLIFRFGKTRFCNLSFKKKNLMYAFSEWLNVSCSFVNTFTQK